MWKGSAGTGQGLDSFDGSQGGGQRKLPERGPEGRTLTRHASCQSRGAAWSRVTWHCLPQKWAPSSQPSEVQLAFRLLAFVCIIPSVTSNPEIKTRCWMSPPCECFPRTPSEPLRPQVVCGCSSHVAAGDSKVLEALLQKPSVIILFSSLS